MSTALAFGAVSAILRNILDNGLIDATPALGATVKVTAVAPDSIKLDDATAPPQLNLFLYRVTPNQGWRNAGLPSRDGVGGRLTNPPLAVDLHYLLTAYGKTDLQADILLGYGMHLLHERPFLDRPSIRKALSSTPLVPSLLPDAFENPPNAGLADQLEALKITWVSLGSEELSRLWSAMQAHYRPSAAYEVSVVLIEATRPAVSPLPVLTRGVTVTGSLVPPYPTIEAVEPPGTREAAELGDTVVLHGHHLHGTQVMVRFEHPLEAAAQVVAIGTVTDPAHIAVPIPNDLAASQDWPAGVWTVSASLVRPGELDPRQTNAVAMLLAPTVTLPPATLVRDATTGAVTVELVVKPHVRPEQSVTLALDTAEATAPPRTAAVTTVGFAFDVLPPGDAWVRLRVDGIQSRLVNHATDPPEFYADRKVTVPP